jgi:ribonuclease-3
MPLQKYSIVKKKLGIRFRNKKLLELALTHSSYLKAHQDGAIKNSNETLEFLGDAVLELLTREYLFKKFPKASEGKLSELKKMYTNTETLYKIGEELELGNFMIMDKGEELTGGRKRRSNIAGCLEAIIGALYLDRGLVYVRKFVLRIILKRKIDTYKDYKSLLNLWIMQKKHQISYRIAKEKGPAHHKTFYIDLYLDGKKVSRGKGSSKKKAEQEAAENFLRNNVKLKNLNAK